MNSAQKLFAKVYEQAQQAGAGAGPNMGGANAGNAGSSKPDDDVAVSYTHLRTVLTVWRRQERHIKISLISSTMGLRSGRNEIRLTESRAET